VILVGKGNPLRGIVENHAKFFKIENFLSKKKKQNKDEDFVELQEAKDILMKEKVRNETDDERFRKNKVMMQATMEECEKKISDGGKRLKDTYKSSKGIKTVKYDPWANL
jgi:phage terminase small subunit